MILLICLCGTIIFGVDVLDIWAHGDEERVMSTAEYLVRVVSCIAMPLSLALLWGKKDRVATQQLEAAIRQANREAAQQGSAKKVHKL